MSSLGALPFILLWASIAVLRDFGFQSAQCSFRELLGLPGLVRKESVRVKALRIRRSKLCHLRASFYSRAPDRIRKTETCDFVQTFLFLLAVQASLREGLGMERDSPKATSEFWSCKICVLEVNKLWDEHSIRTAGFEVFALPREVFAGICSACPGTCDQFRVGRMRGLSVKRARVAEAYEPQCLQSS